MAANDTVSTTTLSAAIDATVRLFNVASTANISAGDKLVVDDEMMHVIAVPVSGQVEVQRGVNGTIAKAHVNASVVHQGTSEEFGPQADSWPKNLTRPGSPPHGLPLYPVALGTRRRDAMGNEYVFCSFGAALYSRQPVVISDAYDATALATTGRGRVGVVAEEGNSDQCGWVQVYGRTFIQLGMAGVSPSDVANGPTTLSTSLQTRFMLGTSLTSPNGIGWVSDQGSTSDAVVRYYVNGISVATDAAPGEVSAVTSAASHVGNQIAVFLNYPWIEYSERHGAS